MTRPKVLIALIAPSGSGKSTVARMIQERVTTHDLRSAVIKLASPLYDLQLHIYRLARVELAAGAQNHTVLESMADHLRTVNPLCIVEDFLERMNASAADVILNDDLRDTVTDWPKLQEAGFKSVRVVACAETRRDRMVARRDLDIIVHSKLDSPMSALRVDEELVNDGVDLRELRVRVDTLTDKFLGSAGLIR
jgi:hypothetical protein